MWCVMSTVHIATYHQEEFRNKKETVVLSVSQCQVRNIADVMSPRTVELCGRFEQWIFGIGAVLLPQSENNTNNIQQYLTF